MIARLHRPDDARKTAGLEHQTRRAGAAAQPGRCRADANPSIDRRVHHHSMATVLGNDRAEAQPGRELGVRSGVLRLLMAVGGGETRRLIELECLYLPTAAWELGLERVAAGDSRAERQHAHASIVTAEISH